MPWAAVDSGPSPGWRKTNVPPVDPAYGRFVPSLLLWPFLLAVAGLIIGSFVATLVIRWPAGRSVAHGRSACDGCGRALAPHELVPVLSALVRRGRCRACGATIDPLHWRIELACGAVGALAGWAAPGVAGVAGAMFGWLLVALAVLDLLELWLPDALTLPLTLLGLASGAAGLDPTLLDRLIGGALGFALLWAVAAGYQRVRGREGMGSGDPKLSGAIGLWLGWRLLPVVLVLAAGAGLAAVLAMRLAGRATPRDLQLPFGTCLAVAAYPAWLVMVSSAP